MDYEKNNASVTNLPLGNNPRTREKITTRNFAGRIGGNQAYVGDDDDSSLQQPDAVPLSSVHSVIALKGFRSVDLWRLALLEGIGSFLLNFVLGALASGLSTSPVSQPVRAVLAAVCGFIALTLVTYCLAPTSGAHITPVITFTTLFVGLTTLPRAILYIVAQTIGALVAGYWLKLGVGQAYFAAGVVPGCTIIPGIVGPGQWFVLEFGFSLCMIFLASGLGLDPRQYNTISPSYAPILVGLAVGLGTMASAVTAPGYTGLSFNPARCLGLMAPTGNLQYHYIHWAAPLAATLVNGMVYHIVPPWSK